MKRYSSAPCLAEEDSGTKRIKSDEETEPNAREYMQLALARVLELQREIKEGSYVASTSESTSDLGDSSGDEDLVKEIVGKVFHDLPGTPSSIGNIIDKATKPENPQINVIRGKRYQLLGYDTCRRAAIEFMRNVARGTTSSAQFHVGTYSRNELRTARHRTGLIGDRRNEGDYDLEIRTRMLRSLDLHLAAKQRDYTAKLMRSAI